MSFTEAPVQGSGNSHSEVGIEQLLLLGLQFADVDAAAAARLISGRAPGAPFCYVVTPNADHVGRLFRDSSLVPIYDHAWIRLLDRRVIAAAARLLGLPTPAVATGSDVTRLLLESHVRSDERITVIGLEPAWLASLVARYGLQAPAHCFPPMGFETKTETMKPVMDFVLANPSRLIFIAVGSPRQEHLCAALADTGLATGTALCVGASLEFLSGKKSRAPLFLQRMGLEWLYRLVCNPRRLTRRYLVDCPPVFLHLLRERVRATSRSAASLSDGLPPSDTTTRKAHPTVVV